MSEKEEHFLQQSNDCWICEKLIVNDEEKVRYYCHVTGKFREAAHWNWNMNFQLIKNVSAIFHNLRGYNSHLIFKELNKFYVKSNDCYSKWVRTINDIFFEKKT